MTRPAFAAAITLLASCAHSPGGHDEAVGWSVNGTISPGLESRGFSRYIISGRPDAVDEFTREAVADGWSVEARAAASADLVMVQFHAPSRPDRTASFLDRYLAETPRRLNIGNIVAAADAP